MKPFGVIYLILNTVNGKYYVGKTTKGFQERWKEHQDDSLRGEMRHLHNALRKYGTNVFTVQVIAGGSSIEELNRLETLWILITRSYDRAVGYNMTFGGDGNHAVFVSAETRRKHSEARKGKKQSEEWNRHIAESVRQYWVGKTCLPWNTGKEWNQATKDKLSKSRLGKHYPKASENHRKVQSEETRRKITASLFAFYQKRKEGANYAN